MVYRIDEHFRLGFPTLLFERVLPKMESVNAGLRQALLGREATSEGLRRSNEGGFHSELDFFKWQEPEAKELTTVLRAAVKQYWARDQGRDPDSVKLLMHLEGWGMVYRHGDSAKPHVHPNSHVSGVYYIDPGTDAPGRPNSGALSFLDPRNRPGMFHTEAWKNADTFTLTPKASLLVLFPSWLYHYAHPYSGEGERLAIAFNASVHRVAPATEHDE